MLPSNDPCSQVSKTLRLQAVAVPLKGLYGKNGDADLFHDVSAGYDDESKHSKDRSNLDEFEAPNDIKSKKSSTYTAPSFKALIVMHPAFDVVGPNSEAVRFNPIFAYELNKSLPPNR